MSVWFAIFNEAKLLQYLLLLAWRSYWILYRAKSSSNVRGWFRIILFQSNDRIILNTDRHLVMLLPIRPIQIFLWILKYRLASFLKPIINKHFAQILPSPAIILHIINNIEPSIIFSCLWTYLALHRTSFDLIGYAFDFTIELVSIGVDGVELWVSALGWTTIESTCNVFRRGSHYWNIYSN